MGDDDNSQTSLVQGGYAPVSSESGVAAPASAHSAWKVGMLVTGCVVVAGLIGFVAGADFGPTVEKQLRGNDGAIAPQHNLITVRPEGMEADAKEQHEQVVTDAEEETHRGLHLHVGAIHLNVSSISKIGSNASHNSSLNVSHHEHDHKHHKPTCQADQWPDKAHGLVCDECKVLVNRFNYFYETCDNYCNMQGRQCTGAWASKNDGCEPQRKITCDKALYTPNAICECSLHVNATLKTEFNNKSERKVHSSCGPSEEDIDYWTDGSLMEAGGVISSDHCRALCHGQEGCGAWTWGKQRNVPGLTDMCFLKKVTWGNSIQRHDKKGLVSGHPWGPECDAFEQDLYYFNASKDKKPKEEEFDGWNNYQGVIRNKHGFCLDVAKPQENGSKIEMMTCEKGHKSQEWSWSKLTGQIKHRLGLCLATTSFQELSTLVLAECDTTSWSQQFDFLPEEQGAIKTWRGPCLDAGERDIDGGSVYLRACWKENWNQQFEIGALEDMRLTLVRKVSKPMSLYCFALMLPGSYEQNLLAMQFQAKLSLFSCEAYSVYSNQAINVSNGLVSGVVDSDLKCDKGGEFGTALNLDIFIAVWKKVVEDAVFEKHDWTVKVDPDAVFFPKRLRSIVATHPETETGVYLNNCRFGLHGPIEVFSTNAVITWSKGHQKCKDHFWELCHGDCLWGEDLFIDQCLMKVLGVRRENDYRILTEDHCDPPKDWDTCADTSRVAFHPFKNSTGYNQCVENAREGNVINTNIPHDVYKPPREHKKADHDEKVHHEEKAHQEEKTLHEAHHEEKAPQEEKAHHEKEANKN